MASAQIAEKSVANNMQSFSLRTSVTQMPIFNKGIIY